MSLRNKLLLLLASIIIIAVSLSSIVLYLLARDELEMTARHRLRQEAKLLATLGQDRFELELRRLQQWAKMPLVINAALNYKDPETVSAFEFYFKPICEQEPYQSIYLIDRKGDCVAASSPKRLYYPYYRSVISKEPATINAWRGVASIARTVLSWSTGRPATPIMAPVMRDGKVIAVLRMVMDTGLLNRELLIKLRIGARERAYALNPTLNMQLPKGVKLGDPMDIQPYIPPDVVIPPELLTSSRGAFRYMSEGHRQIAGFAWMKGSSFVFLVTQPMDEVLSPIRTIRHVAVGLTCLLLVLGLSGLFAILNPVLSGIERCRELAATIRKGLLGTVVPVVSTDEIGQLAQGLNEMSVQLLNNRRALEAAGKMREHARETARHLAEARLKALRYQVNPHFLFNVLNTLDILSRKAPERIAGLLGHLARYLRYSLETRDDLLIPLSTEIQAVKDYLAVEKTRFADNLDVHLAIEEPVRNRLVPEMLFQPLVENAVKYGMRTSPMPLRLILAAALRGSRAHIIVRNSGSWVRPSASASGTMVGLKNLKRRLKLMYGREATMEIGEKEGWVFVRIILPDKRKTDYGSD